ncbi:unnamed protein product [Rotaria socialis]|uniref:SWIM-type domain-containing protein n=1 Tax=Rotaria socialis TaxID=392032 RepID=A0A817Y437_9BILA|nr:unnamed protein product [Rotaria socialis]
MDSDIIDVAKVAITSDTNSTFGITQETITLPMNCTTSSHKTCCICSANMERNSRTVSAEDRDLIFLKKNILIPEGARCCSQHLDDDRLTKNAVDKVGPFSIQSKRFSSSDVQLLISRWQILFEQQKRFDFDNPLSLSDDEYQILTSLTKVQFEDLASYLFNSNIRNSSNRSIRTALAILLCKLRLGLSLNILAVLFQLPDKKAVSRSLKTVRAALMARFVPSNLGFNHITRQEIIDQHTSTMARRLMCDAESNTAIVVIDGTYLYIQFLQRNNLKKSSSKWHAIDHIDIIDEFPILSEDEIVSNITLGTFQLKRARSYVEENASTTDLTGSVNYTIHRCQEFPDIIRVPTQSVHVSRAQYHPIIRFTREEILDWWCDCTAGNCVIGCCSHIASAICFLSFERWQTQSSPKPSGTFINFVANAAAQQ